MSRERHRARNLLVVGQVAMALVLLMSAGLMIRTFAALRKVDPGFADPQHLQTMRISIPESLIAEPERVTRTQNAILDKLAAIQGVKSVGFVSEMPMEGFDSRWDEILCRRQGLCRQHHSALATVQEHFSGLVADGWDKIGCRTRNDVE